MLTSNGALTIAYEETGSGDPVFFVNGTGESGATWGPVLDRLAARVRCITIDLRDTGSSSPADRPYAPVDLAGDVIAVMDEVGPGTIVGFSLGGAVAQEVALARPDLVPSLVQVSTWGRSDRWFIAQMRTWQALRRAFGSDEAGFDRALGPWMFSPATFDDPGRLERISRTWNEAPVQDPEAFCRQCDADIAHDALDRLGEVAVPVVVIVGADDACTPPRYAEHLVAAFPRARMAVVPHAGHCAIFEWPDEVVAIIQEHLDGIT